MIDDALHTLPSVERGGSDTVGPATELEIENQARRSSAFYSMHRGLSSSCGGGLCSGSEASNNRTHGRSKEKETPVARSFVFTALDRGFALAV